MNQSLKMPKKGESARMLAALQAEHASEGLPADAAEPEDATHVTTLQATPEATGAGAHAVTGGPALDATHEGTGAATDVTVLPTGDAPQPAANAEAPAAEMPTAPRRRKTERDDRLAFAMSRGAADEVAVVTVRVSAALNRYMDDYTARVNRLDPKRKYRKQDAVLEAFAAFYADHPLPPAPEEGEL